MSSQHEFQETTADRTSGASPPHSNSSGDLTSVPNDKPESEALQLESQEEEKVYLRGWKLRFLTVSICLSMFLSSLEVTIVSTTLVTITNDFQSYTQATWIITAYLLTYTGFIIIWAKTSDLVGRKVCLTTAIALFSVFSGACGASQSMTQLIIFRAFQGIGGSGMVSLCWAITAEMVPTAEYGLYGALTSFTFAIAYLLGPILGGVIDDNTTWRWIFLLNPPGGVLALLLVLISMPAGFPHLNGAKADRRIKSKDILARVDLLGFLMLLVASIFFVVALQEAGIRYTWASAIPISFLVISGIGWIGFFASSKIMSQPKRTQEPVFPWSFIQNRVFLGVLLVDFLAGVPFFVTIIQIPQRFQVVNGLSALQSGVRLLAFILCVPAGTSFAAISSSRFKFPTIILFAVSCVLQIVGTVLFSTIPTELEPRTYGYEAILGIGVGLNVGAVIILTPNLIQGRDRAVAMATIMQLRALGGVIGLSIAANVLNNHIKGELIDVVPPEILANLLQSAAASSMLPTNLQEVVKGVFADGYSAQMKAMIAFAAAQAIGIGMMWEKKLRRVV